MKMVDSICKVTCSPTKSTLWKMFYSARFDVERASLMLTCKSWQAPQLLLQDPATEASAAIEAAAGCQTLEESCCFGAVSECFLEGCVG